MPAPSWIGQTIGGRYRIESLLGQGGMSAVYKGADPNLHRPVAIKLIHSHLAADAQFVQRFEAEAAAVAQLRHPNIIQVYDFNHDDNVYFMVLEFVPGESLFQSLTVRHGRGQRLAIGEAVRLISDICGAVQYAHERGIIHRDLKPANVMINTAGQPILMDFGIAKIVGGSKNTVTGALVGTPTYISPEQVRGETPDARADIYALGIMLYEMVAGRVPFDGDSALSIMLMHVNDPVPDIRLLNRAAPDGLIDIINKALAKLPAARFQSAREMAAALQPYLPARSKTQPDPLMPAGKKIPEPLPTLLPDPHQTGYAPPKPAAAASSRRLWPILVGLGATGLAGLGALMIAIALAIRFLPALTITPAATLPASPSPSGPTSQPPASATPETPPTALVVATAAIPTAVPATLAPTAIPIPEGMTHIPAGFFQMGSNNRPDEQPIHPVLLDTFYMDTTEVTNAQYRACQQAGACTAAVSGTINSPAFGSLPVTGVNWSQAEAFCQARGKRMPTEAEWEYGAGGPDHFTWPWGNTFDASLSAASAQDLVSVGSFPKGASPFGLLDMAGNATEWVADVYSTTFYANSPAHNPVNIGGNEHVYRGGAYGNTDSVFYTTARRWHKPAAFNDVDVGFRCAQDAPAENASEPQASHDARINEFCALYKVFKPGAACP